MRRTFRRIGFVFPGCGLRGRWRVAVWGADDGFAVGPCGLYWGRICVTDVDCARDAAPPVPDFGHQYCLFVRNFNTSTTIPIQAPMVAKCINSFLKSETSFCSASQPGNILAWFFKTLLSCLRDAQNHNSGGNNQISKRHQLGRFE